MRKRDERVAMTFRPLRMVRQEWQHPNQQGSQLVAMTFRPLRMVRRLPQSGNIRKSTCRNDLSAVTDGETSTTTEHSTVTGRSRNDLSAVTDGETGGGRGHRSDRVGRNDLSAVTDGETTNSDLVFLCVAGSQ